MPSLPRLSVVVFTDGPVRLVGAALERVRPVAHEIVVAVDERVPVADLGGLQRVADRVVRAEFEPPLEANLAWLHAQASGDWVLRLDSDDVASAALLQRLATPGWDEGITHAYLQYRWVVDEGRAMLDQPPWYPDPVLRLFRNEPGLTRFSPLPHELPTVAGDHQLWPEALYHLDLVLAPEAARRTKVDGYERQRPGLRTDRGWSVSTTYYLPEQGPTPPRRAPLPADDEAAVAAVLGALDAAAPLPPVDAVALGSIARLADRRTPPPGAGEARVQVLDRGPVQLIEGRSAVLTVSIANAGERTWRPDDSPATVVGGRFAAEDGEPVGFELRAPLPGPVPPGREVLVRLAVPPGVPAEAARLRVGLVQDGVGWYDTEASIDLRHRRGRRVLVSTGISATPHLGDDLITAEVLHALARHLPDVVPVLLAHPTDGIAARFGVEVAARPVSVAPATTTLRRAEPSRRSRDLVAAARRMAKGEPPDDPAIRDVLEPFARASALVVAPGGGLASRYADEALLVVAGEVLVARAFGLPVLVEGPSIGPLETRRDQAATAEILNAAASITVRDRASADAARRVGRVVEAAVVPDPATAALAAAPAAAERVRAWRHGRNIPDDRGYAVISLRGGIDGERHLDAARAAIEALPEHTALVHLPHCTGDPGADDRQILDDPWFGAHLVPFELDDRAAAVALVAGATIAIGSRFHLAVLAAAAGVPAVGLVGDEYDRLRLRGVAGTGAVRRIETDEPEAAATAVRELLANDRPEPGPRWDGEAFAARLGAQLPPAPSLA
ncbi:MAG TPA: polysaccharide pyruvyl transferase family protein [Aquihabitans sp.]|nr:polysaccharide pyruvyl transferase family protein [Aquihabitans sp.]